MSTKTRFTAATTWTPDAWVTKCRPRVAGGAGGSAGGYPGGRGVIVDGPVIPVSGGLALGVGSRAGGSASGSGRAGGAASVVGDTIAGGGSGVGYQATSFGSSYFEGSDAGVPGQNAPPVSGGGSYGDGQGGRANGDGGAAFSVSGSTGNAGQSNAAGGKGGNAVARSSAASGGAGGGYGGGASGAVQYLASGSDWAYTPGDSGGGSSTGGTFVGYNDGAPWVDMYVAGAPKAPTALGPIGNVWVDRTAPIELTFAHNPDTPGDELDALTDAKVEYRKVGSGDSWTVLGGLGTSGVATIPAGTLEAGVQYEWRPTTKADGGVSDAQGIWGATGDAQYFRAGNPPTTATITTPTSGQTIGSTNLPVAYVAPGQVERRVWLVGDDGSGSPDMGTVYDQLNQVTASTTGTLNAAVNNVPAHVVVSYRTVAGGVWSAWAEVDVDIDWVGPPKPRVTLATDWRSIHVTVTNPAPVGVEPVADRVEVYVIEGDTRQRRAILAPGDGWVYETPPSGVDVGIEAVAIYTPTNVQTSSGVTY